MQLEVNVGPQTPGKGPTPLRGGFGGEAIVSLLGGDLAELCREGRLFMARAIVTAPVIFSTAAGTGGPLIWNGSTDMAVRLHALAYSITTASGVVGALGITGGTGQSAAPSSTTAIDSNANMYLGGSNPASTAYRIGTVTTAGAWFLPLADVTTAATSVPVGFVLHRLGGIPYVPPNGGWVSVAASATLTSAVMQIGLLYEECKHT